MDAMRDVLRVPLLNDPHDCVEIDLERLPRDAEDCAAALQAELAPLEIWIEVCERYLRNGDERGFEALMGMVCAPEIEEVYRDSPYGRCAVLCLYASYWTNKGRSAGDAIGREECFIRATQYLNAAGGIHGKAEQIVVIGRAHLAFARGEASEGEKLVDQALGLKDDGRDNVTPMLWKANLLYKKGKYSDALTWYRRALRAFPTAPAPVRLGIGACQYKLGDYKTAKLAFARVLKLDDRNVEAMLGLALCELSLHDIRSQQHLDSVATAMRLLERAFALDPHNQAVNNVIADNLLMSEEYDKVEVLTRAALQNNAETARNRAKAAFNQARALHGRGAIPQAQALYNAATQLDESYVPPYFGLGQIALAKGDVKSAWQYMDRAHGEFGESITVTRMFAHLCASTGKSEQAAEMFREVVKQGGSDLEAMLELGELLENEDPKASVKAYSAALKILAANGEEGPVTAIHNNIGVLNVQLGKFKEAREALNKALESLGGDADQLAGKLKGAKAKKELPPGVASIAFNLALLEEHEGNAAAAEARYNALLTAQPDYVDSILRQAKIRAERGDYDLALERTNEAITAKGDNADAIALAGWILLKAKRWGEAEQQFESLRNLPKPAVGSNAKEKTLTHDEYAMVSAANAAYYSALKEGIVRRSDPKVAKREEEHYERAYSLYQKTLQKNGSNVFAANGLGIVLAERGRIDEAKTVFQLVQEGMAARGAINADILINQGHVHLAKAQYVQAAKLYERAQNQFYFNQNEHVMLYQAKAHYENGNLDEARKILCKALKIAPWNHRIRFNLAYVIQEVAQRTLNRTMKSTTSDGRLAQVESAIEDLTMALKLFEQLQALGNQTEFGFDVKRTSVHVSFCKQALTKSKPHLDAAQKEEDAILAAKNAQMAARRAAEEGRAARKAAEQLAKETHAKELEAIAAETERRFKESQARWMATQAEQKPTKKGAKGVAAVAAGEVTSDLSEDDDEPAPEERAPPTAEELARQKQALAAVGLGDSDSDVEDDANEALEELDDPEPERKRPAQEAPEPARDANKRRRRAVVNDDDDEE